MDTYWCVMRTRVLVDIAIAAAVVGGAVAVFAVLLSPQSGPSPTAFPVGAPLAGASRAPSVAARPSLGDWPTYGFSATRVQSDPVIALRPPYRTRWRYRAGDLLVSTPSIYGGDLYFSTDHGRVVCLRAADGRVIWRYRSPHGAHFASTPTVDASSVYVTSLGGRFLVLDRLTGKPRWALSGIGPSVSSPLVWRHRAFFGGENGIVYAVSLSSHKVVWRYQAGGAVRGAPAELDGRIVVGASDGSLSSLSYSGRLIWSATTGGILGANQFHATAALSYGTAYIGGTDGTIYAFALSNGGLRWSFATGDWVYSPPAVWRNLVFEGSHDGYFYGLNAATGRLVWKFHAGSPISGAPTVLGSIVYVSSVAGRTWALNARTGRVVWTFGGSGPTPVTTDRRTLYLNGGRTLYALTSRR
jgi:outer membrane protein assembly factor BamB